MPSRLDYETLRRSGGRLPFEFLRGCGLEDWEVSVAGLYGRDLTPSQVETIAKRIADSRISGPRLLPRIVVSYNWGDSRFVAKLASRLIAGGWRIRRRVQGTIAGSMAQQIADAIDQQGSVVAVLSKKSKPGDWLPPELANPPAKHKSDGRDVLFAVSVDDSWETLVSPTWNQLTRQQNVFDFSDWMDDEHFDMSFDMLGHALRVRCTPVDASR